MNNEVLRRKMFRTVLADSRAPAGILASSPEMVDTVSRRATGGLEARRKLAGQQFMRQFAGMPEGSRKPESYLQVLDRIKGLPYNQQVQELTKAGYDKRPVSIISRSTTERESRLDARTGEFAAIAWALIKLRVFVYGRNITVVTDHHSLRYLFTSGD